MKRPHLLCLFALAAVLPGAAQDDLPIEDLMRRMNEQKAADAPRVDSKRIVNESNSFLKEREPAMTEEEYALYEKVVTMLTTNPAFALKMLEAMMNDKEPPSPAFEFILGNACYAAGQIERAEKSYRSAVKRYPNFVRAWNNLGLLCYTSNRFADAIPCLSKAVVLGDRDPSTFGLLGFCLEKEGNVVSAEMAYMQALSGDPANPDWKEGLLRIYIEGKQFGRAENLIAKLVQERPAEKRFWLTRAGVALAQGRKIEAVVLLETSVGIGVAGADELLLLGDLYAEQNLAVEAVAAYQKALGSERDRGEQRLLRFAHILIAAGELTEAEQTLAALKTELTPHGRLALLQGRADLLIARKRWAEARTEAETLLQLAPLNGRALLTVGRTYAEEHDVPRAMIAFEAACQIPESTYRACLELAAFELKNRRYAKSVSYLEKALGIHKTEAVEDYLARVRTLLPRGGDSG
ncbi:MAG TPA: tetratricopeptide repeat protein [Opitutaceae bacterium]|nr:tetratricopeptide repeat protein [Opitutaceae bacterium]